MRPTRVQDKVLGPRIQLMESESIRPLGGQHLIQFKMRVALPIGTRSEIHKIGEGSLYRALSLRLKFAPL